MKTPNFFQGNFYINTWEREREREREREEITWIWDWGEWDPTNSAKDLRV